MKTKGYVSRFFAILLCLAMVAVAMPAVAFGEGEPEGGFVATTFGTGAESWAQTAKDENDAPIAIYNHTQFLVSIDKYY